MNQLVARGAGSNRYELLLPIGTGGTATVYLARVVTGGGFREVAIKLIHPHLYEKGGASAAMLLHEASLAARIGHPNVVPVLEACEDERGLFLVMDYVAGTTLWGMLREARARDTGIPDRIVARVLSEALAGLHAAHELVDDAGRPLGLVHRDFSPSNLMIGVDGVTRLTDFGIAKSATAALDTTTGNVKGKIGYMAPEQVLGDGLDRRVDVWAAGVVAWECLAGRRLFRAENEVATMRRIVNEPAPSLAHARPDVARPIADVVAWALERDRDRRPGSADVFRDRLVEAFRVTSGIATTSEASAYVADIAHDELELRRMQVADVLRLSRAAQSEARLDRSSAARAYVARAEPISAPVRVLAEPANVSRTQRELVSVLVAEPTSDDRSPKIVDWVHTVLTKCALSVGGTCHAAGQESIAVLSGPASSRDRAARAVASAYAASIACRSLRVAICTDWAEEGLPRVDSSLIERARALLRKDPRRVLADELTRQLVGDAYDVAPVAGGFVIVSPHSAPRRELLGIQVPCVARERELAVVQSMMDDLVTERTFRAATITAEPGIGKSRLLFEILQRASRRGDVAIVKTRSSAFGAGHAFRLAQQIVAGAIGGEIGNMRDAIARHTTDAALREALAEILGVVLEVPPSNALVTARKDPRLRAEYIQRGFHAWLVDYTRGRPLLLLLDDVQWADTPSLRLIDDAARAELPVLVTAASRPPSAGSSVVPWPVQHAILLRALPDRAAETLLREVLPQASESLVRTLVERARGNAFYLEELARWVTRGGHPEAVPPSAVALAMDRLSTLEPEDRRLLRAASVFGEQFFLEGALAVLGDEGSNVEDAARSLERLRNAEVVNALFDGVYAFRHAFLHEATYASLSDHDRAHAHLAAAKYLLESGETDALVLARHYELGGDVDGGRRWTREAALAAFAGSDFPLLERLSKRLVAEGASDADLGLGRAMLSVTTGAQARSEEALAFGREALKGLEPGTPTWFLALGIVLFCAGATANGAEAAAEAVDAYLALPVERAFPGRTHGGALVIMSLGALNLGRPDVARALLERGHAVLVAHGDIGNFRAWLLCGQRLAHRLGDPGGALAAYDEAILLFRKTSDRMGEACARFFRAQTSLDCGITAGVREDIAENNAFAREAGLVMWVLWGALLPAVGAIRRGDAVSARPLAEAYVHAIDAYPRSVARALLAACARIEGDRATAVREAQHVLAERYPEARSLAAHVLGSALLAEAKAEDACRLLDASLREAEGAATYLSERAALRALLVGALHAAGRAADAEQARAEAIVWAEAIARSLERIPGGREAWLATPAIASLRAVNP
ncbi:MAG: protein kinase [Polyangiaceae bacterium]|nr:protein kinase [Polyangiaceae bacterium]